VNRNDSIAQLLAQVPPYLQRVLGWYVIGHGEIAISDRTYVVEERFSAKSLLRLHPTDADEYCDLSFAVRAVQDNFWLDGIGFRLSGPFWGIQIHNCFDSKNDILPEIRAAMGRLAGYWERGTTSNSVQGIVLSMHGPRQSRIALYKGYTVGLLMNSYCAVTGPVISSRDAIAGFASDDMAMDLFMAQLNCEPTDRTQKALVLRSPIIVTDSAVETQLTI
jgi:hypothetical protein